MLKLKVLLQGDVFYPDIAIDLIYLKEFFAFGRGAELYALKFDRNYHDRVKDAISKAQESRFGRLWSVYRAFEGFHVEKHAFGPTFYKFKDQDSPLDFDKMEQYNNFIMQRRAIA